MLPMLDQQSWISGVGWNLGMIHGVSGLYKGSENLRSSSESVRFRFYADSFPDVSGPIVMCGGCECARFTFVESLKGPTAGS